MDGSADMTLDAPADACGDVCADACADACIDVCADAPDGRSWGTAFPADFLQGYHRGVTSYRYRGVSCLKSPVDLALYLKLLFDLAPRTVIEIGAHHGGSAVFFADQCQVMRLGAQVISVDAHDRRQVRDHRVRFVQGDARRLWDSALPDILANMPRPWLVIEDSAHTPAVTYKVLQFLMPRMEPGDVVVVEDGVLSELGLAERFSGGPSVALKQFLGEHPDAFEIMADYADFFGPNATYSPNGWLRRL